MGLVCVGAALADVPQLINYQGRLTDTDTGEPLTGSHEVVFKLYDLSVAGAELWSESQTLEADQHGVVSAILGAEQPIGKLPGAELWLEVAVDGEVLQPRRKLVSVPFALRAATAEGADSVAWDGLKDVPDGFADGIDDLGGVGDGYSLDAADGDPTDALYVDNEGNVGIGTTGPTDRLTISHDVNNPVQITVSNNDAGSLSSTGIQLLDESGSAGMTLFDNGAGLSGDELQIHNSKPGGCIGFVTAGRENIVITEKGHLGIGHGNAQFPLQIVDTVGAAYRTTVRVDAAPAVNAPAVIAVYGLTRNDYPSDPGAGVVGEAWATGGAAAGVQGNASGATGKGVFGWAKHTTGVNYGVYGRTSSANGYAGYFDGPRNYFSGKIGIGTETPQARLHIHEVSAASGLQITNATTGATSSDGLHLESAVGGRGSLINMENEALDLGTRDTTRLTIHPDGKISIGSRDTLGTVTITNNSPYLTLNSTYPLAAHAFAGIGFGYNDEYKCDISWDSFHDVLSIGHGLYNNLGSGWLGVGNIYPGNLLDAQGAGSSAGGVNGYTEVVGHFTNISGGHTAVSVDAMENLDPILYLAENGVAYWDMRTDSDNAQRFQLRYHGPGMKNNTLVSVDTLGNVGLGTDPDITYRINVAGLGYASTGWRTPGNVAIGATNPGSYKLYVAGNAYTTGTWGTSDVRLKDKIQTIDGALPAVLALRGVGFEWRRAEFPDKGLAEGRHYGLVAQEVERVLPDVVSEDADGYKAIAYDEIIPVLVEAMKAQEGRIQALEQQVEELRSHATGGR
jgi:hypothetical protein